MSDRDDDIYIGIMEASLALGDLSKARCRRVRHLYVQVKRGLESGNRNPATEKLFLEEAVRPVMES